MRRSVILSTVLMFTTVLVSFPVSRAQTSAGDRSIRISSYQDDPFVDESSMERIEASGLELGDNGRPMLSNAQLKIVDEPVVYLANSTTGEYEPFATNPWPQPMANEKGSFKFPLEERFPLHLIERGGDGKPILNNDGLQIWKDREIHLGMTTIFDAATAAKEAAEEWAGRNIAWGDNGFLGINSHAFIAFNAFFSPTANMLFFGVVPYRPAGQTQVRMFEMGTSWEVAAHETGHALHGALKPNRDWSNPGYRTWSESFSDQLEMWASLRDPRRIRYLLATTGGNFNQRNALTILAEALGDLIDEPGVGMRDAFHDKKVSETSSEVHDRSEVLTGAAYKLFVMIYEGLKNDNRLGDVAALEQAADIMGTFLMHCVDYTPETEVSFEDATKAYLKVDKELFGGRYHAFLVNEFTKRELLSADSINDWLAHEAAVPDLLLPRRLTDKAVDKMIQANLDNLGIGPEFGLAVQSVTQEKRFGHTIVRVQLTEGRGSDATLLDNYGILTFRADRTLADYHSPIPGASAAETPSTLSRTETIGMLGKAKLLGLDRKGAPLSIVRLPEGRLSVEARVMSGTGMNCYVMAYTLQNAQGERREVIVPTNAKSDIRTDGTLLLKSNYLLER